MTVLEELAGCARMRVAASKEITPLEEVRTAALAFTASQSESTANDPRFERDETPRGPLFGFGATLIHPDLALIAEIRPHAASESTADLFSDYKNIAQDCAMAGVDGMICPTEPTLFGGSEEIFSQCRQTQSLPMLCRDFIADEYQIYLSKLLGAQAIPLVCSILDEATIKRYLDVCDCLELDALVEIRNAQEASIADRAGARIIGILHRDEQGFSLDRGSIQRLRKLIPWDCVYVAESNVRSAGDVADLARLGADAAFVGEALMATTDKKSLVDDFRAAARAAVGPQP